MGAVNRSGPPSQTTEREDPVINWDNIDAWPQTPPESWPKTDMCQAKAALIRHFARVELRLEVDDKRGSVRIRLAGSLSLPSDTPDKALDWLDGFLAGCEAMADRWNINGLKGYAG